MSAPYKVMEQMQKTRPRRLRGNREVMIVLGAIIIVGMLLLVNSLNKRLNADNRLPRPPHQTGVKVGSSGQVVTPDAAALIISVSLNEHNEWMVEGHGVATLEELPEIFAAKRDEANGLGVRAILRAQIAGDQPAKHFLELHRIAESCELDEVSVQTHEPLLDDVEDGA